MNGYGSDSGRARGSGSLIEDAARRSLSLLEVATVGRTTRCRGEVQLGPELEGPPGRLHGGHHAFVRTFAVLDELPVHRVPTSPCRVELKLQKGIPLGDKVGFEGTYEQQAGGWSLHTRFLDTERLDATIRSIPFPDGISGRLERWKEQYRRSCESERSGFEIFGSPLHFTDQLAWVEVEDPRRSNPDSDNARLVRDDGTLGACFCCTTLDLVGATARGTLMRHPHFTKHFELTLLADSIPASTPLLCLADREKMDDDPNSTTRPVDIRGQSYGTSHVEVALMDAAFQTLFAWGRVTVHPVDAAKFEAMSKFRHLRKDT